MRIFNFDEQVIPLDDWIQQAVDWLVLNYRDFFQMLKTPIEVSLNGLDWLFTTLPPFVVILFFRCRGLAFCGQARCGFYRADVSAGRLPGALGRDHDHPGDGCQFGLFLCPGGDSAWHHGRTQRSVRNVPASLSRCNADHPGIRLPGSGGHAVQYRYGFGNPGDHRVFPAADYPSDQPWYPPGSS